MLTFNTIQDATLPDFEVDEVYKGALNTSTWAYDEYGDDIVYG